MRAGATSRRSRSPPVVEEQQPDVVLMDIRMPGRDGLSTTRELLTRPTPPRVLMLTTFDSDDLVLGALRAGVLGFVLKDTPPARILDAVRTVADGLGNPEIAERLHIGIATVKAHTGNLFAKLTVENRVQIALLVRDAEE
ncbi:response regulator [Streptomyces scopuliridis]|uniref:response regulator n=1 Tax=Streptomyces scopuliridis TaxID=452529 RepID=UPI00369D401C